MEKVGFWVLIGSNPVVAAVFAVSVLIVVIAFVLMIKKIIDKISHKGGKIKKITKDGIEFAYDNENNVRKEENDTKKKADYVGAMLSYNNHCIAWRDEIREKMAEIQSRTISDCISKAVMDIDNLANEIRYKYSSILSSSKKEKTIEDNYQIIIYQFVVNQAQEKIKDDLCRKIREDRLNEKTDSEIKAIAETCYLNLREVFKVREELSKEILLNIDLEYKPKIINIVLDNLDLSEKKYQKCKLDKEALVKKSEENFNLKLKTLFPSFELPEAKYEIF